MYILKILLHNKIRNYIIIIIIKKKNHYQLFWAP